MLILQLNYLLSNLLWIAPSNCLFQEKMIVRRHVAFSGGLLLVKKLSEAFGISLDKHCSSVISLLIITQMLFDEPVSELKIVEEHAADFAVCQIALHTMFYALEVCDGFHLTGQFLPA